MWTVNISSLIKILCTVQHIHAHTSTNAFARFNKVMVQLYLSSPSLSHTHTDKAYDLSNGHCVHRHNTIQNKLMSSYRKSNFPPRQHARSHISLTVACRYSVANGTTVTTELINHKTQQLSERQHHGEPKHGGVTMILLS